MKTEAWNNLLRDRGYYAVHYILDGSTHPNLNQLREWLAKDSPRYTGWPPFWVPARPEIAPRVIDQWTLQCTHDGTGPTGMVERWRASTKGDFTIIRMHDLDESDPGEFINLILPVWRVAEILLHAARMSERFSSPFVDFSVKFTGLRGRRLTTKMTPGRILFETYTTDAHSYEKRLRLEARDLQTAAADVVLELLDDFYALFQFQLPPDLCVQEIEKMTSTRF